MATYQPIDCNYYDILEALATLKRYVRIQYKSEIDEFISVDSLIKDLYIKNGFEYMLLADGREIRLDRLISVDGNYRPGSGYDELSCECD